MSDREQKLWPFKPRTSIAAAVLILFGLLLTLVILRVRLDWPSPESETAVLLGIVLLSLLPILLVLVDTMIERGGVVEIEVCRLAQTRLSSIRNWKYRD